VTLTKICAGAAALALLGGGAAPALAQPGGPPTSQPQPGTDEDPWSGPPQTAPGPAGRMGGRLFVSPAGEVYRPGPGGRPFAEWFRRADGDGDGALTWDEFRADFARVFTTFDTDGDGEIEPEEVTHYETDVLPEMSSTFAFGRGGFGGSGGRRPGRYRGPEIPGGETGALPTSSSHGPRYSASMTGAARFGLLPIPHPIMEADLNFNRGVSREEWEQAARRRFTLLDTAHNGRLTVPGLLQGRMASMGGGPRAAGDRRDRQRRGNQQRPRVDPGAGGTPLPQD
jgi:EF hand